MKKGITYKTKGILLIIATVLVLYVTYSSYLSETISTVSNYYSLKDSVKNVKDAPLKMQQLKMKLKVLEQQAGLKSEGEINFQENLLRVITKYSSEQHTIIRSIPQKSIYKDKGLSIETNEFTMEGSYSKLLDLLYTLEQKERIGRVAAVRFRKETDLQTKRSALMATYYIQTISKENETK